MTKLSIKGGAAGVEYSPVCRHLADISFNVCVFRARDVAPLTSAARSTARENFIENFFPVARALFGKYSRDSRHDDDKESIWKTRKAKEDKAER